MTDSNKPLPFRMAQCRHAHLEAFRPDYFEFLKEQGCHAIYLQNSPFDPMRTGNVGQFFDHFHLISLFDISRSHRRQEYQDYVNEICARASEFEIQVWLDCWEPRLPAYAQTQLPPSWRGQGGWGWHGRKEIAFCWEHPEAVQFWKSMARDAIQSLPGLSGAIISMIDNEASFCDVTCPRCQGNSLSKGIVDVFRTFGEIAERHPRRLRLAMYDWWIPEGLMEAMFAELPSGSLVIGRSSRGVAFHPPDGSWEGVTTDISNVVDALASDFRRLVERIAERDLEAIDMVAWSRGMENFFLPAPPDPIFAIRKCRSLREAGAVGWMDYDCGCMEPGSLAAGIREWTADPEADEEVLVGRVLDSIWGRELAEHVRPAYESFREARDWMPVGLQSSHVPNMDARCCGFGFCLFAPFFVSDLGFADTDHAKNYFAPYNLIVGDSLPHLLLSTAQVVERLGLAFDTLRQVPAGHGELEILPRIPPLRAAGLCQMEERRRRNVGLQLSSGGQKPRHG
jgi:hypothetical protein